MTITIVESPTFKWWVRGLRDRRAVARINARLRNISIGNLGDTKLVGDGISEIRIHHGPGYRIYFIREGTSVIILLCGGDKGSQRRDVERARNLAVDWRSQEMAEAFSEWDATRELRTEEDIRLYLEACADEDPGDGSLIRAALNDIARTESMSRLASEAGMSREGLNEALSEDGNPTLATVMQITNALGMHLRISA